MAYYDQPLPISCGQTISAPHMHVKSVDLLSSYVTRQNARILDVGSGSGYLSAVFADLARATGGGKCLGIEYHQPLVQLGLDSIKKNNANLLTDGSLTIVHGDGWSPNFSNIPLFDEEGMKFDAIHVGAAPDSIPSGLVDLMKADSRMLIPVGPLGGEQIFTQVVKDKEGKVTQTALFAVRYVPLVHDKAPQAEEEK
jgi:protein-L-isoaspartate(D-aspartate) O-methyltransferase